MISDDVLLTCALLFIHQTTTWQRGQNKDNAVDKHCIVRVINIVTNECRLLSSRERAPFLVVCEVVDTNLTGNNARLFAVGADNIGATLQEVLGTMDAPYIHDREKFTPIIIPTSLMESSPTKFQHTDIGDLNRRNVNHLYSPRGGWQSNGEDWYHDDSSPFDTMRQQQIEELHQQLSSQNAPSTFTPSSYSTSSVHQMNNNP